MSRKVINVVTIGEAADRGVEAFREYLNTNGHSPSDDSARAFMVSDAGIKLYGDLEVQDVPAVALVLSMRV
jgi:hypothetical protein